MCTCATSLFLSFCSVVLKKNKQINKKQSWAWARDRNHHHHLFGQTAAWHFAVVKKIHSSFFFFFEKKERHNAKIQYQRKTSSRHAQKEAGSTSTIIYIILLCSVRYIQSWGPLTTAMTVSITLLLCPVASRHILEWRHAGGRAFWPSLCLVPPS